MIEKCQTCKKPLHKGEVKYCDICFDFHLHNYSREKLFVLLQEYERLNK